MIEKLLVVSSLVTFSSESFTGTADRPYWKPLARSSRSTCIFDPGMDGSLTSYDLDVLTPANSPDGASVISTSPARVLDDCVLAAPVGTVTLVAETGFATFVLKNRFTSIETAVSGYFSGSPRPDLGQRWLLDATENC